MKQRLLSAIALLLIIIPIIIIGGNIYHILVTIISMFAFKELIDMKQAKRVLPLAIKAFAYPLLVMLVLNNHISSTFVYLVDYRIISVLLVTLLLPLVFYKDYDKYNIDDALFLIGTIFFLGISFNLLILVRNYNINYLIYIMLIAIITDTYAYIGGMLIGKNKLVPAVSPNKTWEGIISGVIFGTLFSSVFYYEVINSNINILNLVFISGFLCIIGQLGDLVFSSIKRYYNKKDYSNIIPGHGGILDRLDSIILVIIAFTLFITII